MHRALVTGSLTADVVEVAVTALSPVGAGMAAGASTVASSGAPAAADCDLS